MAAARLGAPHVLAEAVPGEAGHAVQRRPLLPPFGRQPRQDVELDFAKLGALDGGDRAHEVDALEPAAVRLAGDLPAREQGESLLEHPDTTSRQRHGGTVGADPDGARGPPAWVPGQARAWVPGRASGYPVGARLGTRSLL